MKRFDVGDIVRVKCGGAFFREAFSIGDLLIVLDKADGYPDGRFYKLRKGINAMIILDEKWLEKV